MINAPTLSYVPVIKQNVPNKITQMFLTIVTGVGPSERPHFDTKSISGGIRRANDVEHIEPIREMNKFKSGTISEIISINNYKNPN